MAAAAAATQEKVSTHLHIHDDIAFSILSKLPVKSLKRFTCVQKSWSCLFKNPIFMDMFRTNCFISKHDEGDDNTHLLLRQRTDDMGLGSNDTLYVLSGESYENKVRLDWPPPFQKDNSYINILCSSSVNGILSRIQKAIILLWNPTTGEFKVVPHSHLPYEPIEFNARPLGFGYDHVTDDYKVIRFADYPIYFEGNWICLPDKDSLLYENNMYDCGYFWVKHLLSVYKPFWEIYSLKSNSWRKLDCIDVPVPCTDHHVLILNEFCLWLGSNNRMVSFNFSTEIFVTTDLPSLDSKFRESERNDLVLLNGSVVFICRLVNYFHIWILGELGVKESWLKLSVVGPVQCIRHLIGVGINNVIFYMKNEYEVSWFDLSTQRIGVKGESIDFSFEREKGEDIDDLHIVIYKESLLSFGGTNY